MKNLNKKFKMKDLVRKTQIIIENCIALIYILC